jgi:site-specific DNA-methyltransferase (adenine-specific)
MNKILNSIIHGDCVTILNAVKKPFADLIFADPPFNIGKRYDSYNDKQKKQHYIDWTRQWIGACCKVLKSAGSFYIAIGDDYAAYVKTIAEDELGLICRNWIIWHYTFGQQTKNKFARSHTHILYFVKDKKEFTFNDFAVRTPSDRQLIYNDKRADSGGKMPDDVWDSFSRVCGTFKERQGWHPCQMPELLLARIIAASSNAGDCVLDPFIGSGTTAVVAVKYGRSYCGIDISQDYAENTIERIEQIKKQIADSNSGYFNTIELEEIKRLFVETGLSIVRLVENDKLLDIFTRLFTSRMNNARKYDTEQIALAVKGFIGWDKRS